MRQLSRLASLITSRQRAVAVTACIAFVVVSITKFLIVVSLLSMGIHREVLQVQDAILTGGLAAALVWVLLAAVRVRQKQQQQQLRVVADLNHHLRNALSVILASEYLRESEKATAILESVERIDTTLRLLLPQMPTPPTVRWGRTQTTLQPHKEERRKAPRISTQQQVAVRFTRDRRFEIMGIAKDVSTTGIFLYLDANIVEGMEVELLPSIPRETGGVTMPVRGKVVRVERLRPVGSSGIAVAFEQMEMKPAS
jgi:hypothetical protein